MCQESDRAPLTSLCCPRLTERITSQLDTKLQKAEQKDVGGPSPQEEVLILSLQATISSLEKKVSALRRSEAAAMNVVAAYRKLWDSTTQVMRGRPTKFVTGTHRVETRWDKKAIKSLVAEVAKP